MLYSKYGSIPKPFDESVGLEGWIEVEPPPTAGEGQEVVWWYPPGWVVRPVMPAPVEGHCWSWSQTEGKWILCEDHNHTITDSSILTQVDTITGNADSIFGGNGNDTIGI